MIDTDFMPYCSECGRLSPIAEMHTDIYCDGLHAQKDWIIRCAHYKECQSMARYLKKELSKENKNGN